MSKLTLVKADQPQVQRDFLSELNNVQREAASVIHGPLLIIAGAGSGKTRVLTYRIAHMISTGISPKSILALTFTNKAAGEMRERIGKLVGASEAKSVWAGTFHSIFARILRSEAENIGYSHAFTIYDTDDTTALIKTCMSSLGISQQQIPPASVRSIISGYKNDCISWQEAERIASSLREKQAALVYQDYERRLKLANAMDFDDLLWNFIRLMEQNPQILKRYQEKFQFVLVDEYQDTNRSQYRAINLLVQKHNNICVVGDDAQSIYGWRGADIRNILDFQNDYPQAKVVRLEQNYRSTKTILEAANAVIANNRDQLKKSLWTSNYDGEKITIHGSPDDRAEADFIAQSIKSEIQRGKSGGEMAVLFRTNAQSQQIEDALRRETIPYIIVGGVSFYKRKEVKDSIAYLRLALNPNDSESLLRVVNEPPRGLGKTSLERLVSFADKYSVPLFTAFERADEVPDLQLRAITAAQNFAKLIRRYEVIAREITPEEFVPQMLAASGLMQMYRDEGTNEAKDRLANIDRVIDSALEYAERAVTNDEVPNLTEFLQQIALVADTDGLQAQAGNSVTVMSLHSAKGLEFPTVFIAGLERGLFPLQKAEFEPKEMEEERRLFYVGITRAEEKLYLSYAQKRYRFGELTFPGPSQFLREISNSLVEFSGTASPSASEFSQTARLFSQENQRPERISSRGNYSQNQQNQQNRSHNTSKPTGSMYTQYSSSSRQNEYPKSHTSSGKVPSSSASSQMNFNDDYAQTSSYSQIPDENSSTKKVLRSGALVEHAQFGRGKVVNISGEGDARAVIVLFTGVGQKKLLLKYAKLTVVG